MTDGRNMIQIVADTSARYRITTQRLRGRSHTNGLSIIRREAMVAIYATGRYTKAQIGAYFDGRGERCVEKLLARPEVARRVPVGADRRRRLGWASPEAKAALQHAISTACAEMGHLYGLTPDDVLGGLYDRIVVKARREAIGLVLMRTQCPMVTLANLWGVDRKEIQNAQRKIDAAKALVGSWAA